MKFIITIDDAERRTIEELISLKLDYPIVIGVPVGLTGKVFEDREIASLDILREAIKELNVEIASHGYYHTTRPLPFKGKIMHFIKHLTRFPDKLDTVRRTLYLLMKHDNFARELLSRYDAYMEIVKSKSTLQSLLGIEVITYLYPGGYTDEEVIYLVSKHYKFARSSEIGINLIKSLISSERYNLRTISFSRFTDINKIERYYKNLKRKEKRNNEILIIETFHHIAKEDDGYLYFTKIDTFVKHMKFIANLGEIVSFRYLSEYLREIIGIE